MPVSLQHSGDRCVLHVSGKFTFDLHRDFRQCSEQALDSSECATLEIDLTGVDYLDSSALGMLLLARDKARPQGKSICLAGARGVTLQILQTVKFDEMFEIR